MLKLIFGPSNDSALTSLALLALRLWFGLTMLINHGLDKFTHFNQLADGFPDPLGIGHKFSLALVVFAEVVGASLVSVGLLTRFAALTLVIDMGVAFLKVHKTALNGGNSGELAFLYLAGFVAILIAGAGKLSADKICFGRHSKASKPAPKH